MIIRKTILSLFLFFSITVGVSYSQVPATDLTCPQKDVFVKAAFPPVYKKGMDAMKAFFSEAASELLPPGASGSIELNVVICHQDEAVLLSLVNKTEIYVDTIQWKRHFEDMKGWKAGIQNGRPISYSIKLILEIKNGMIVKLKYSNGATTIESAQNTPAAKNEIYS